MTRWPITTVVFLLAGAVVNVAVAWGFAIRTAASHPITAITDLEGLYLDPQGGAYWWCQVTRRTGHTEVAWEPVIVHSVPSAYRNGDVIVTTREITTILSRLHETWGLRKLGAWLEEQGIDQMKVSAQDPAEVAKVRDLFAGRGGEASKRLNAPHDALDLLDQNLVPTWARTPQKISSLGQCCACFGWPMGSCWYEAGLDANLSCQTSVFGGWRLADRLKFLGAGEVLPYRVIPVGFAANTVLYTAILWLIIRGPFALRRYIRVRRGLCPACAYPIPAAGTCTECGQPLPQRAVV